MRDIYYYESIEQLHTIAEPTRWRILDLLVRKPMTGAQLARALKITRTRAHYHIKVLEKVGLIELHKEQINQGIVEKYYQAIAKQFRSDILLDRSRLAIDQHDALETGRTVRGLMLAILELARVDVLHPGALPGLARLGFQRQDEWYLTTEQAGALMRELSQLAERYAAHDRQNRPFKDTTPFEYLRYTWLLTPVGPLTFDTEPEAEDEQE